MSTPSPRILVVDDEPNTCAYLAHVLKAHDWQVDTACDGPRALEMIRGAVYDAVVLDFRMPDMNGADLARAVEHLRPGIPRILLTGYPTIDTVYPAVDAGVSRVLAKPVNPRELVEVLEAELSNAHGE